MTFRRAFDRVYETLKIQSLYPEQEECLRELIGGKDVYASLPTGYGKSVIFFTLRQSSPMKSSREHEELAKLLSYLH